MFQDKIILWRNTPIDIGGGDFPQQFIFTMKTVDDSNNLVTWCRRHLKGEWSWVQLYRIEHFSGDTPREFPTSIEVFVDTINKQETPFIIWVGCENKDGMLLKLKWPHTYLDARDVNNFTA